MSYGFWAIFRRKEFEGFSFEEYKVNFVRLNPKVFEEGRSPKSIHETPNKG